MDREDMKGIFKLLKAFFPTAKQLQNREMWAAWLEELAPYEAPDVEQAVRQYARKNKFFPDLADLIVLLPQREDPVKNHDNAWMTDHIDTKTELGSISRYAREHGISWEQAEKELIG